MVWLRVQMALLDAAGSLAAFAANWLLQSTLLITAGLVIAWLARHRGAAVQSAIYRTTLAAVVVCPLATLLLWLNGVSGWSVPMPVAWSYEAPTSPPLEDASKPEVAAVVPSPASEPQSGDLDGAVQVGWDQRKERAPTVHAGDRWVDGEPVFSNQPSMQDGRSGGPPIASALVPPDAQSTHSVRAPVAVFQVFLFGFVAVAIAVVWVLGTTLLVARLTFAWHRLNRLIVVALPADSAVQEACRQVSALMGVTAPKVLSSPYLASPCLTGWPRAAVLLPEVTPALPLRDVLIHELAHLRRGDAGWNLVARLTQALFFYQPLVWLLARRLESSAEEVCDDFVVQFGGDRSQYARGLLEIAELATTPVGATAVTMVSLRSILARRVTRIMDSSRSLSTRAGNLLLALVVAGGLMAATIVGFVGLAPHSPADAANDEVAGASESSPEASDAAAKNEATATFDDATDRTSAGASADVGDDLVVVSGQVVDPKGKPFTGAKLYAVRWYWEPHIPHPPLAETTSGANGKFTISYRKSQFTVDVGRIDQWKEVTIVATADGFGAGWVTWRDIPRGEQPTLRLVADDVPIAGRVVDLEGKPVAGVAVRVGSIHTGKGDNLDAWLEAVRRGEFPWTAAKHLDDDLPQFDGWPARIATDNDGRFRVNGLGREHRVKLSFSGPAIAYQEVEAVTRRSEMFPLKLSRSEKEFETVYGAEFELVAPPTQPITGVVRDAETHQPLAGVSIESNMFAGSNFINTRQLRAVSDEQGRYRLVGMPKGAGNRILAVPTDDQPYLMRDVKLPESRGLEPVQIDIELHRGIWITGRITDLRTGAPLIARVHYLPFRSNEYAQKTPEFGEPGTPDGFQERYVSRPDGSYRLVGLPGRAIVGAECELGHYRKGVGADSIAGMNEYGHFETYFNPVEPGKKWPNAMKEINPAASSESVVCDLALDPGEKLTVNVLDPDRKPIDGFEAQGSGQSWSDSRDLRTSFDVITLGPDETRTVVIRHKDRRLGKVIRVKLADHPRRSLSVTLEPMGRILGRLLDQEGTPISGAAIEALVLPTGDFSERLPSIASDAQGRFEYTDVPTGCRYDLNAEATSMKLGGWFAKDVALEPGETKDLGDVVYGSAAQGNKSVDVKQSSEPAKNTETTTEKKQAPADRELRGRVIGSDGKSVAGAKLYWLRARVHDLKPEPPRLLATTGDDGNYHFAEPPAVDPMVPASWSYRDRIVVVAPGHGFVFTSPGEIRQNMTPPTGLFAAVARAATSGDSAVITLPVAGEPIRGRLVDVNGQPVAGAKVRIRWFNGEKDVWGVADLEARGVENARWHARAGNLLNVIEEVQLRDVLPAATTDAEGRFELRDIGQKRLVQLLVQGQGIEATEIVARNEPGEKIVIKSDRHQRGGSFTVYPNEFVFAAGPSKPVEGRVLDLDTGEPIAGAVVRAFEVHNEPIMTSREREHFAVTTDSQGHYRIAGLPIGKGNNLVAFGTGKIAYAPVAHTADTSAEVDLIKLDFRLKRGVWAEGRVFDGESNKPFTGEISYYFFRNRGLEEAIPGLRDAYVDGLYWTDGNGQFRVPVLPTRGILAFRYDGYDREGDGIDRFPRGFGGDEIAGSDKLGGGRQFPTEPHYLIPENYERVAEVAPIAGQETIHVDMPLFASPPVTVRVGAMGEPVTKFEAYGNERWQWQQHDGPEFSIDDLRPGERRKVFVFHRERNLAGGGFVEYGAQEAVRIELVKAGSVTGRLVDTDGEPIDDAMLSVDYEKFRSSDNSAIWANQAGLVANPTKIPVDKQGRFRLDGLIPGWQYHAHASAPRPYENQMINRIIGRPLKGVQVESGEVKDLGDVVIGDAKAVSDKQEKAVSTVQPAKETMIRGRVIDLEGRPVVGARVQVTRIWEPAGEGGKLDDWLADVRAAHDETDFQAAEHKHLRKLPRDKTAEDQAAILTDAEGRFQIDAGGKERIVQVRIENERIESLFFRAVTRPIEPLRVPAHIREVGDDLVNPADDIVVYGSTFDYAAAPGCRVEGTVRDEQTGEPLPNITVKAQHGLQSLASALTDAKGHFLLTGISAAPKPAQIVALAAADVPYMGKTLNATLTRPGDRATVDFELGRGVWIEGQVTDKPTGRGVQAAVEYYAWRDNPYLERVGAWGVPRLENVRVYTDEGGKFRLLGLPGVGLVSAETSGGYVHGIGRELVLGVKNGISNITQPNIRPDSCNAIVKIDVPAQAESFACQLELDPGRKRSGTVLGPDDKPLEGVHFVAGWKERWTGDKPLDAGQFTAEELVPGRSRTLVFVQVARKLIGTVEASGDGDEPLEVRLRPWAGVRGRVVDDDGNPRSDLLMVSEDLRHHEKPGKDGRFAFDRLLPGVKYTFGSMFGEAVTAWQVREVVLQPGEFRDVGDVVVDRAKGGPRAPPLDKNNSKVSTLRGQVVDPQQRPVAGATVFVRVAVFNADDPALESAVTDAAGRFEFSFHWPEFDERTGNKPNLVVVANADGLAPDWEYLRNDEPPGAVVLNLPKEEAIVGRIVNEEGRPIAGVELKVEAVARYDVETMKMVLDDVAQGRNLLRMGKTCNYGALSNQPGRVATAADGRFRIGGLSANTVVKLHLRGPGIRETRFNATTAVGETIRGPVPPVEPPYGPRAGMVLYGSPFDYVAEPGRRIKGTVRDHETGMPLARAKVMIYQPTAAVGGGYEVTFGGGNDCLLAETDDAGRYLIDGCAKNSQVALNVDPPADGPAYFPAALPVEDAPGLAEVVQNVDLVPGIELRGRIVDNETAQPLTASLQYAPLYLNKYAAPLYEQGANLRSHTRSDADGSFRLAVARGPGAVAVSMPAASPQDYTTIRVSYEDVVKLFEASPSHRELAHSPDLKEGLPGSLRTQGRGGWSLLSQTGEALVILVCPEEKKPSEPVEVRLVRGRRILGKVVDPDGQPLAGARAYLNNPGIGYQSLSTAEFTVSALASGEKRNIAFQHDERRLGAFRTISADEAEPLIVPLEPYASARGRTLDEQRAPIQGLHVWFYRVGDITSEATFAVTDADGRFHIDNLIPKQSYEVMRTGPGSMTYRQFSPQKLIFSVAPGKLTS